MATVKWTAPTSRTTGISSQSVSNAAGYVGSEIDNETNLDRFGVITLDVTPGTAPTEDYPIWVWLLLDPTSADYEDGDTSTIPKKGPVFTFAVRNSTSAQRVVSELIQLPPTAFKIMVWNASGQTCTITAELEAFNESVA